MWKESTIETGYRRRLNQGVWGLRTMIRWSRPKWGDHHQHFKDGLTPDEALIRKIRKRGTISVTKSHPSHCAALLFEDRCAACWSNPWPLFLQSSWGLKGTSEVGPFGVTMNKHKGAGGFRRGDSGPHADPVYVFGSGFVLSRRCKTPSPWDKRWLMPLNERHFYGPGLLKRFIRLSSDLSTHSAHGSLWQQSRKAGEASFEVLVTAPSHKTLLGIEIWLALTDFGLHTTLRALRVSVLYKYQGHQKSSGTLRIRQLRRRVRAKHGLTAAVPSPVCTGSDP